LIRIASDQFVMTGLYNPQSIWSKPLEFEGFPEWFSRRFALFRKYTRQDFELVTFGSVDRCDKLANTMMAQI
jgi:hypothetical protein